MRVRTIVCLLLVACGGEAAREDDTGTVREESSADDRAMVEDVLAHRRSPATPDASADFDATLPWFGPYESGNSPPYHHR